MAGENSVYVWSRDHRLQTDSGPICVEHIGESYNFLSRQAPPQVQRDAGRPTQRQQGLLLLPHGLADGQVGKGVKGDIVNSFLCRKHPAVMKAGKTINMSDLEADSLLMFQHRHYLKCFLMAGFVLPTIIPNLLWGESLTNAYFMAVVRWIDFPFICFFTFQKFPNLLSHLDLQVRVSPPLHLAGQLRRPHVWHEALRQEHRPF